MAGSTGRIAIVGMGCRFGGAPDLHAYWRMCVEGRHDFKRTPPDRWDHDSFFDANVRATDRSYCPTGAWIDNVREFPALALGIPPRRVEVMDPQQRMSLEIAIQAIHDAGYLPEDLPRRTGVFMGVTATEYRSLAGSRATAQLMATGAFGHPATGVAEAVNRVVPSRPFSAPGALANMIAAAVAQELDLHGPAYTTDAACASALMAVHDAVVQLRAGTIDAALAGGAYLCFTPEHHIAFSRIGAISASGVCRPFDHRADGFVQGDGVGAVLLKRLADAQRDGDRIYAVITGVAINNDGRGDGPMAPVKSGQVEVIRTAWSDAGTDPSYLGYMEAHGTGTDVGDVAELEALVEALGGPARDVVLGSSKANVGHTMSAAGIAGLIRAALAIHHETLPPMASFEALKPGLPIAGTAFRVPKRAERWHARTKVAAVSSFGFGGTNGHAVLVNAPERLRPVALQPAELVLLSAPTEEALKQLASRTAAVLADDPSPTLSGLARTLCRRPPQAYRMGVVARSVAELREKLLAYGRSERVKGLKAGPAAKGTPKLAFLYPGQGSQRVHMLRAIRDRFPVVARTLDEFEAALDGELALPLTHLLYPERRSEPVSEETAMAELTATEHCQPVLLAAAIALTRLLDQVGVRPHVVTGHSLGEFTAAATAGVLSAHQAAVFVARRGRAMADLEGDAGAMAAIMAEPEVASDLLVHGAVLANVNHPRQVVVSGTTDAVRRVVESALAADLKATPLVVSHAFHSPVLEKLDVRPLVDALRISDPAVVVASGIAAHPYRNAADARDVFLRHAVSPVDFVRALGQCKEAGADLYLQVGAGGPLASFARGSLEKDHRGVYTLASLDDAEGDASLLETLAELWIAGVDVDLRPIIAEGAVSDAPPVVFPTEPYWVVSDVAQKALNLAGVAPTKAGVPSGKATAPAQPVPAQPEVAAGADAGADLDARVLAVIAKVSAYPIASLRPEMALAADLGFDSLMVSDLATHLADAFPGLGGIPQELLINGPTVSDIVGLVKRGGGASVDDSEDERPLGAYEPTWVPAPLPAWDGPARLSGRVVFGGFVDDEAGRSILGAGLQMVAADQPADWIVWFASPTDPVPVHAVLAGEAEMPDAASELLDLLDAQAKLGATPSCAVVHRDGDPWGEAEAAVARTVGREWPAAVGKSIAFSGSMPNLAAELASGDVSPAVRYDGTGRFVRGFSPVEPKAVESKTAWTPGPTDVVLVTGGTRGIGARIAGKIAETGARVVLVGRGTPSDEAHALLEKGGTLVRADVTERSRLEKALDLAGVRDITAVVHAAGSLADGAFGSVDRTAGRLAREVKAKGWLNAIRAAGPTLKVALGIGSWAGRFGSRHQARYAAGNALMAALASVAPRGARVAVSEFGPWTGSEMASTIPAPVAAAMRAEGVDFAGPTAGLQALWDDLCGASGAVVRGRRIPAIDRVLVTRETLSTETHPYLLDHALDGTPVLPLAAAADLVAHTASLVPPFEVRDLKLFAGIAVTEPVSIAVRIARGKAEIRAGERNTLCYQAFVGPVAEPPVAPEPPQGGEPGPLPLSEFYGGITFHGPKLQGIQQIRALGPGFATAEIATGRPSEWMKTSRDRFAVDPKALDSLMQVCGYVAWVRYQRAGTPVGIGRFVQVRPWPDGTVEGAVHFAESASGDRFTGTLVFRDATGAVVALAEDVVAELKSVAGVAGEPEVKVEKAWVDPTEWQGYKDLSMRLQMAEATGIRNPYFAVHEGTARDTTVVAGRTLVNFSSYNYVGLSGDPRVVAAVKEAVERYGTSVSASRVASGERPFHAELEALLASCQGAEDALVFTAGHATNVTTIGHLLGDKDLVLHDELIHDSALQGIKLSGASRRPFKHDDPKHLEAQLKEIRASFEKVLVVVEGVYSMDGDLCALPEYVRIKKKYGCLLMVDEAHSFGIVGKTGRGIGEHHGVDGKDVDLWMGTLSKSLASCGGWIAGSKPIITYLRYTAPGFVYSAGLTPANGVAALTALKLMLAEPERVQKLQENARIFHDALVERGLNTGPAKGGSAVVPVVTGNSLHALLLSQRLVDQGINVQPIVYPAVADDAARLRFFLSSTHTAEQLVTTAERVRETLAGIRAEFAVPG